MNKPESINEKYIAFTEESNSIDYLEKACLYIKSVKEKPTDWKWVILSLHEALYGFMICALFHGHYGSITKGRKRHLIGFYEALKMCQKKEYPMDFYMISKPLTLTPSQKKSIDILHHTLRNKFNHYRPGHWLIEKSMLPQIVIDVLEVIEFLIFESCNIIQIDHDVKNSLRRKINKVKSGCLKLSEAYR